MESRSSHGKGYFKEGGKWATKCNVYGECGFRRAKTAEPNEPLSRMVSNEGSRNRVLRSTCNWRHLANTVERLCFAAVSALWVCHQGGGGGRPVTRLLLELSILMRVYVTRKSHGDAGWLR